MPVNIRNDETEVLGVDDLVDYLFENKINMHDHDALIAAAPMLARLSNNRTFLAEQATKELDDYKSLQESNSYGPQVFMLFPPRPGHAFFLRACFWPSQQERLMQVSGERSFFYHQPHDHNFNFLTVGYFGPGYWSNYFKYNYDTTVGVPGEEVELEFVEKSNLHQGKLMLYRAFTDIHDQLPSDSFSVSLNIMENTLRGGHLDQYAFDVENSRVDGFVNRIGAPALFDAVAHCGDEADRDILRHIAQRHPSNRVRCCALQALSSSSGSVESAMELLASVPGTAPALVRGWVNHRLDQFEMILEPTT